jgi:hypothetical protein
MTVVVAGFEFSSARKMDFSEIFDFWDDIGEPQKKPKTQLPSGPSPSAPPVPLDVELANDTPTLAFLVADSVLSTRVGNARQLKAEHEQKVQDVLILISVPDFTPDGYVTGAHHLRGSYSCGVAYAGSQFTFTQVIQKFERAMGELVYTWNNGKYQIVEKDSKFALESKVDQSYADDIDFNSRDLPKLDADFVLSIFERCVTETIADIFIHYGNLPQSDPASLRAEFALAVYCIKSERPKLFHVEIVDDLGTFPTWFKVGSREIANHELLVLGHTSWLPNFQAVQDSAVRTNSSIYSAVERECERLVQAAASTNYVGGKINCGYITGGQFKRGHPVVY